MKKSKLPIWELAAILIGEALTSLIVCGIFLIVNIFKGDIEIYKVVLGAVLGSVVTFINFLALSIVTNKLIDKYLAERGSGEMDEEEAANFAAKYQGQFQLMAKLSYIIRTIVMIATLLVAIFVDVFNVISTLVPLLMFRPIITVSELLKRKRGDSDGA